MKDVNIAVWFEIPVTDFDRAIKFYVDILSIELVQIELAGMKQGLFPHNDKSLVSGALV